MKIIINFLLFFSIFQLKLASANNADNNSLLYNSPICSQFSQKSNLADSDCLKDFSIAQGSEVNELASFSNSIKDYGLNIGSIGYLKKIIQAELTQNITRSFHDNLIVARGLGNDLSDIQKKLTLTEIGCDEQKNVKENFSKLISLMPSISNEKLKKNKEEYLTKINTAVMEQFRITKLIDRYSNVCKRMIEMNEHQSYRHKYNQKIQYCESTVERLKRDLNNLRKHYPILHHVTEDGEYLNQYAVMMLDTKSGYYREDYDYSLYSTLPDIDQFLSLPKEDSLLTKVINPSDLLPPDKKFRLPKRHYLKTDCSTEMNLVKVSPYEFMQHKINCKNFSHKNLNKKIESFANQTLLSNIEGLKKICQASPCEIFSLTPHTIGNLIAKVDNQVTKNEVQKYICSCDIQKEDETLSGWAHLGIFTGTIAAAVGCITFAPLCIVAGAAGVIGVSAGVSDFNTQRNNTLAAEKQSHIISAVSSYEDKNKQILTLAKSQSDYSTAMILLPLEFLGAAGDVVAITKVVTPFRYPSQVAVKSEKSVLKIQETNIAKKNTLKDYEKFIKGQNSREQFVKELEGYDIGADEASANLMRREWIDSAINRDAKLFLDIENGRMKRLNDLGDKEVVTALTNMHKKIFLKEMEKLKKDFPDLDINTYSDFKSLRFSFNGKIPDDLKSRLSELFVETEELMDDFVIKMVKNGHFNFPEGELPHKWFASGFGKNADEAGIAAREARCREETICEGKIKDFNADDFAEIMKRNIDDVLTYQKALERNLINYKASPPLTQTIGNKTIPSRELIEVMRKNLDLENKDLYIVLQQKFGVIIKDGDLYDLKNYINSIKKFEPGLWIESRKVASLTGSKYGGLSADFTGMGSYNLEQIAKDFLEYDGSTSNLLNLVRAGEQKVTAMFNEKKDLFKKVVEENYAKHGIKVETICSGDDCIAYPLNREKLDDEQLKKIQEEILKTINKDSTPDGIRLSLVRPNSTSTDINLLATHGELIEKEIRKISFGHNPGNLSNEIGSGITFAIRMPRNIAKGKVQVLISHAQNLTEKEISEMKEYAKKSIEIANKKANELAAESGHTIDSQYTLDDIIYIRD